MERFIEHIGNCRRPGEGRQKMLIYTMGSGYCDEADATTLQNATYLMEVLATPFCGVLASMAVKDSEEPLTSDASVVHDKGMRVFHVSAGALVLRHTYLICCVADRMLVENLIHRVLEMYWKTEGKPTDTIRVTALCNSDGFRASIRGIGQLRGRHA